MLFNNKYKNHVIADDDEEIDIEADSNANDGADLYHDAPSGLHGHRDEGDDGVRQGEVEDEEVHVGPRHQVHPGTTHVKLLIYAQIS